MCVHVYVVLVWLRTSGGIRTDQDGDHNRHGELKKYMFGRFYLVAVVRARILIVVENKKTRRVCDYRCFVSAISEWIVA